MKNEIVNTSTEKDMQHITWWKRNKYDPAEDLKNLNIPVLSLMRGKDALVPPETNEGLMKKYLSVSRAPYYTVEILSGAHHELEVYAILREEIWNGHQDIGIGPIRQKDSTKL